MLGFPSRQRPLVLLAAVVSVQVLLLAAQIKRQHDQVRLIRVWAVALVTPFQRAGTYLIDGVGSAWNNYVDLRHAREENETLREELSALKLRVQHLESRAAEADRLAQLLAFREAHPGASLVAARVIAASPAGVSKTVTIDRGQSDGIRKNMGVITPDGVVGKILEAYGTTSLVLLMTDRESGVGARLEKSRTSGVIRGTGAAVVQMQYVVNETEVEASESIITSGQDQIFPKDLPIGTVISTQPGSPFKVIRVQPAAGLDQLEEVFVLLNRQEWQKQEPERTTAKVNP